MKWLIKLLGMKGTGIFLGYLFLILGAVMMFGNAALILEPATHGVFAPNIHPYVMRGIHSVNMVLCVGMFFALLKLHNEDPIPLRWWIFGIVIIAVMLSAITQDREATNVLGGILFIVAWPGICFAAMYWISAVSRAQPMRPYTEEPTT